MAGRPPNVQLIKKAKELQKKGLSYREIAIVLNRKDKKTIFRWVHYPLAKLGKYELDTRWQN